MYFFFRHMHKPTNFHYEITFINIVQLLDLYYRNAGSNILRYVYKILLPWDTHSVCLERSWVKYSRGLLPDFTQFSVQRYFAERTFPNPLPKTDPTLPILCHCVQWHTLWTSLVYQNTALTREVICPGSTRMCECPQQESSGSLFASWQSRDVSRCCFWNTNG